MHLCDYGCGQKAIHQFKNGKWCCSEYTSSCPIEREKNRVRNTGKSNSNFGLKRSDEYKRNLSQKMLGKNNPMFGASGYWNNKKKSKEHLKKIGIGKKSTIEHIKEKYPIFTKIEKIRYEPGKEKEKIIQTHCKNYNCKNSKEKGGWFTPTKTQLYERIRQVERGSGGCHIYCSEKCKQECPLFRLRSDPLRNKEIPYTEAEKQLYRKIVLDREDGLCEYCGAPANIVHHILPQKTDPLTVLDPDYGVACCTKCHYKYGHRDRWCTTGYIAGLTCTVKKRQNNK